MAKMFRLILLATLLSIAFAAPGYLHGGIAGPLVHAVGAPVIAAPLAATVIGSVPAAVSHTSNSVIHSTALASPVIAAAPLAASHAVAVSPVIVSNGLLSRAGHLL